MTEFPNHPPYSTGKIQTKTSFVFHQKRNTSQKISDTLTFLRENISDLIQKALIIIAPVNIAQAYFYVAYEKKAVQLSQQRWDIAINPHSKMLQAIFDRLNSFLGLEVIALALLSFLQIALLYTFLYTYMISYSRLQRRPSSDIFWQDFRKNIVPISITFTMSSIIVFAIAVATFWLLFIPALFVSVQIVIIYAVQLDQKVGFWQSFAMSKSFSKGNWWASAGFVGVVTLMAVLITFALEMISTIALGLSPIDLGVIHGLNINDILTAFISNFIGVFFYFLLIPAIVLHYFSLKAENSNAENLLNIKQSPVL